MQVVVQILYLVFWDSSVEQIFTIQLVGMFLTTLIKLFVLLLVRKYGEGIFMRNVLLKNGQLAVTGFDVRGNILFEIFIGEPKDEIEMSSDQEPEDFENEMEDVDANGDASKSSILMFNKLDSQNLLIMSTMIDAKCKSFVQRTP